MSQSNNNLHQKQLIPMLLKSISWYYEVTINYNEKYETVYKAIFFLKAFIFVYLFSDFQVINFEGWIFIIQTLCSCVRVTIQTGRRFIVYIIYQICFYN